MGADLGDERGIRIGFRIGRVNLVHVLEQDDAAHPERLVGLSMTTIRAGAAPDTG
jgi:hypothetical protein